VIVLVNILQVLQVPDPFHGGQSISILELAGRLLAPLLAPLGLGSSNWQASVALISGLFAKEAIVGSLSGLYAGDAAIRATFGGTAPAVAYLIFILLYSPCAATLAILFREHGRRWMLLAFFYLTALAWIVATVAYQVLAFNPRSWLWLGISLLLGAALYLSMKFIGNKHAL
jgi:ferrous iron transport protein B